MTPSLYSYQLATWHQFATRGWLQCSPKCYWIKKLIEPFRLHTVANSRDYPASLREQRHKWHHTLSTVEYITDTNKPATHNGNIVKTEKRCEERCHSPKNLNLTNVFPLQIPPVFAAQHLFKHQETRETLRKTPWNSDEKHIH